MRGVGCHVVSRSAQQIEVRPDLQPQRLDECKKGRRSRGVVNDEMKGAIGPQVVLNVFLLGGTAEQNALPAQARKLARLYQFGGPFRGDTFDRQPHAGRNPKSRSRLSLGMPMERPVTRLIAPAAVKRLSASRTGMVLTPNASARFWIVTTCPGAISPS